MMVSVTNWICGLSCNALGLSFLSQSWVVCVCVCTDWLVQGPGHYCHLLSAYPTCRLSSCEGIRIFRLVQSLIFS